MPIQLTAYEFVPDKAGAGKFRGGVPFRRDYRFLEHEGMLQVRSDRRDHRPFGLYGGSPGGPSENYLNPDTENRAAALQAHDDDQARRRVPPRARRRRRLGRSARARSGRGAARRAQRAAVAREGRGRLRRGRRHARWTVDEAATEQLPRRDPARARLARGAQGAAARSDAAAHAPRNSRMPVTYRVGVDIGGTFTDIVLLGSDGSDPHQEGRRRASTTTPRRSSTASPRCSRESGLGGARDRGDPPRHHGRLQRDPRAQGRARRPDHHQGLSRRAGDPHLADAAALRPRPGPSRRRWSSAICARWSTSASITAARSSGALDPADAERAVDALLAEKVEAIAVCLINSFANPAHELMLKEIVAAQGARACR